jgi:hypothetical protein
MRFCVWWAAEKNKELDREKVQKLENEQKKRWESRPV